LLVPSIIAADETYYVSTDGKAENSGTAESPWDITSALAGKHSIAPGSFILLEGRVYRHPDRTWTARDLPSPSKEPPDIRFASV